MNQTSSKKRVVVGMSGGVDSSVAALLLQEQGYDVIGLFMKNWEETTEEDLCQSTADFEDVALVCEKLKIPYYSVNLAKEYWEDVFSHFLSDLKAGFTPNPDVLCNREIKFKAFFNKALALGADLIATGHYCQTKKHHLLRGADKQKDQSYFLYAISSNALKKTLFPVGHLRKETVRTIARMHALPVAEKRDSTGICFIGKRKFSTFIRRYLGYTPGKIETVDGKIIGKHQGIAYHTIGQRKGLGIGGPGEAWFVVGKDPNRNVVIVAQGKDHPALFSSSLTATDLTWIRGKPPIFPLSCTAKVRYRSKDVPCKVNSIGNNRLSVTFEKPIRAITPRQSVVFYDGPLCLGGGMIAPL